MSFAVPSLTIAGTSPSHGLPRPDAEPGASRLCPYRSSEILASCR